LSPCGNQNEKTPPAGQGFLQPSRQLLSGDNAYEFAILGAFYFKHNLTIGSSEEGVVMATAHVLTGVEAGATLTHDDVTGGNLLTTEYLHAKAFRF
jgi:hypothetical protein